MKQMTRSQIIISLTITLLLVLSGSVMAQEATIEAAPATEPLPAAHMLTGFTYEPQMWNNCGPATLTMAMTYFGYGDNQVRAANWLKPNNEDKNVSPWQMLEFVNTQVPEISVYALQRYGGTIETIKTLLYNGFPVVIEAGYDPASANQGWMGHYLLIVGYDDASELVVTYDSYDGQGMRYNYLHVEDYWQHFNYTYIVLYSLERQAELLELLGDNGDEYTNLINTLQLAQAEATVDQADAHAWFNLGSTLALIADKLEDATYHQQAAIAYDNARNLGLPWRMTWYQFGIYEAYLAAGRYQDVLDLVAATLNDGGGQYVEESYYYAGIAREMMGDTERAVNNYNTVLSFNPNFTPARERRDALLTSS
jgi:tetratricopeptide (TPR) repeat protein